MKKVRLVMGAAGMAPVIGLVMAGPAAAGPHPVARQGKTISLRHSKIVRPDAGCIGHADASSQYPDGAFAVEAWHTQSDACVGGMSAFIMGASRSDLSLRTRVYTISTHGAKTKVFNGYTGKRGGTHGSYSFYQGIHQEYGGVKQMVCGALVLAGRHSVLWASPLCPTFPA